MDGKTAGTVCMTAAYAPIAFVSHTAHVMKLVMKAIPPDRMGPAESGLRDERT